MDYSAYNPASLFNISPGGVGGGAGETLPRTSHMVGDRGAVPWSPDSPQFWAVALLAATLLGIVGASVSFRAGPGRASASIGKV